MALHRDRVLLLINEYQKRECLWNVYSVLYKRKHLKSKAWRELAKIYRCDVDFVKKKVKYLRTAYLCEKKKVDASLRSGLPAANYEPKLYYYNEMRFLDSCIISRRIGECYSEVSAVEKPELLVEREAIESPPIEYDISLPEDSKLRRTKKIERSTNKYDAAIAEIVRTTKEMRPKSMFQAFGESIAAQLETLPRGAAFELMASIQQVLSNAEIRLLQDEESSRRSNASNDTCASNPDPLKTDVSSDSNLYIQPASSSIFSPNDSQPKGANRSHYYRHLPSNMVNSISSSSKPKFHRDATMLNLESDDEI